MPPIRKSSERLPGLILPRISSYTLMMEMKADPAAAVLLIRKSCEAIPISLVFNMLLLISKLGPRSAVRVFSEIVRTFDSMANAGKARQARIRMADRIAAKDFIFVTPFDQIDR
jgi:hypothetical protein